MATIVSRVRVRKSHSTMVCGAYRRFVNGQATHSFLLPDGTLQVVNVPGRPFSARFYAPGMATDSNAATDGKYRRSHSLTCAFRYTDPIRRHNVQRYRQGAVEMRSLIQEAARYSCQRGRIALLVALTDLNR